MLEAYNLGSLCNRSLDGDQTALIDLLDWDEPRVFTHAQLDDLSNAVARTLLDKGLRRGERVAILSANRAEFLISYFGIMRAGLVAVPVSHKLPIDTVEFAMRDAGVKFAFCDHDRRPMVSAGIPVMEFGSDWVGALSRGDFKPIMPTPRELAMVLFTSGSSGRPKGVALTHEGHLWAVRSRIVRYPQPDQRLLIAAPLFHMNALGTAKFAIAAHASIVLMSHFVARHYVEAIGRFRCTFLTSVPTMLALAARESEALHSTDLSSVQTVRMGSAPVTGTLLGQLRQIFPRAEISNVYGTTEAGPVVFGASPEHGRIPPGALGWPRNGVEVRLVDEKGEDSQRGVLWQKTPAIMLGYLNLPEKTREVLTEDGWYKSGDVFERDVDGCYHFVGRADDMFVCGGENIYPVEVEQMLEGHPEIVQACVVPVSDEIKGAKPFAFVVTRPGASLTEDDVKQYALQNAAAYQHPRRVLFLPSLPLMGTNKVDRKALERQAAAEWRRSL